MMLFVCSAGTHIRIPDIDPKCSVPAKNAPHFTEHLNELGNVFVRSLFKPDLPVNTVVPESIIWG